MTRCDYDGVFYRVFCVTLLAIAFTFTVILTNVFVDIDGLLAGKKKDEILNIPKPELIKEDRFDIKAPEPLNEHNNMFFPTVDKPEPEIYDMKGFEDDSDDLATYRTKRSLDSTDIRFHIKDPKIKKILTNRLALLLEEIDEVDFANKVENPEKKVEKHEESPKSQIEIFEVTKRGDDSIKDKIESNKNDLLHLAMHNILLQGIIGHMNSKEMYQKLNYLVNKDQKEEVAEGRKKAPKLLIKTVIDIKSLEKDKNKNNDTDSKEDIKGIIKVIYNGKSIKFNQIDDKEDSKDNDHKPETQQDKRKPNKIYVEVNDLNDIIKGNMGESHISDSILYDTVIEYFNKHLMRVEKYKNKRLKRNVKVRGTQKTTTQRTKTRKHSKSDDEELYVEIETHFDGKGIKGEKKKKLVRSIIEKIQKAIRTDLGNLKDAAKEPKRFHIKKRIQNPLDQDIGENIFLNKMMLPVDAVIHRELDPISKSYAPAAGATSVGDQSGDTWKRTYVGPHFFSSAKAINSAEMGEVAVNYDKESKVDGVVQRLQKPLNSDIENIDAASFYQLGNLKFYIKDIDGTGFSIGLNQYRAEPPDEESMKTFTGIDNLLKTYSNPKDETEVQLIHEIPDSEEYHDMRKREIRSNRRHMINRRSVDNDYHSNEYKIIFNNNFLPYDSYQEIIEDRNKKVHLSYSRQAHNDDVNSNVTVLDNINAIGLKDLPFLIGDNIFDKELRPSEIFKLSSLFTRNKRSMKVQKYSKLNNKSKLNRYINTNSMAPKRLFLKNKPLKRNKRQIDKIRIYTADNLARQSNENFFVVSDENMFANRALVKEMDVPDNTDPYEPNEEPYGYINPFNPQSQSSYMSSIFSSRSRHNPLMSKYPHIFMEEISRSKEDMRSENAYTFNNYVNSMIPAMKGPQQDFSKNIVPTTEIPSTLYNVYRVNDLVEAISPRTNYKLTVKILPKNESNLPSGFKEIHTSINKSISKNGLMFSSLLNVSEISKVEKIVVNQTDTDSEQTTPCAEQEVVTESSISPLVKLIRKQQEKMKNLLKQHRQKIDTQLQNLNQEKATIETIIFGKNGDKHAQQENLPNAPGDGIEVLLPSDPPQRLHLTRNEAGQLITSALMKLREKSNGNGSPNKPQTLSKHPNLNTTKTIYVATKSIPTNTVTTEAPPINDPDKMIIMNTIQQNENLTNTILTKIDRNTDILQKFLQRFPSVVDQQRNPQAQTSRRNDEEQVKNREGAKSPMFYQSNWKDPFLKQMPDLEVAKNDTRISIPFVYAYQQPYPLANNVKTNNPIASVVYQGHIHTNALRNSNKSNTINNINNKMNNISKDIKMQNPSIKSNFF